MAKIRREQMELFERQAREKFLDRVSKELRAQLPEETSSLSDDELSVFILRMEELARTFGIDQDEPLGQFITLGLAVGESIYDNSDVRSYLRSQDVDQHAKMTCLLDAISELGDDFP